MFTRLPKVEFVFLSETVCLYFAVDTIRLSTSGIHLMAKSWKVNDRDENCADTMELAEDNVTHCVQQEVSFRDQISFLCVSIDIDHFISNVL